MVGSLLELALYDGLSQSALYGGPEVHECTCPNKKYTGTWYINQYKQQYCTSTYICTAHEQVWQPYAVDPYYSAISKWWPYLLALQKYK